MLSYSANSAAHGQIVKAEDQSVRVPSLCGSGEDGLLDQHPKAEAQGPCLWRPSQKRLAGGSSLTSTKYAPFPRLPPVQEQSVLSQQVTEWAEGVWQGLMPHCHWPAIGASLLLPNANRPIMGCHLVWVCLVGSLPFSRGVLIDGFQKLTKRDKYLWKRKWMGNK